MMEVLEGHYSDGRIRFSIDACDDQGRKVDVDWTDLFDLILDKLGGSPCDVDDEPARAPFEPGWQLDTPVHEIIGQAIGAASMCWANPAGAGVFDSERAGEIVETVMAALQAKLWTDEDAVNPTTGHHHDCGCTSCHLSQNR